MLDRRQSEWPKETGNAKCVYTLVVGGYPKVITDLTFPLLKGYARKIGADFYVIDDRKFPEWPVTYEKLQIHELAQLQNREWAIYIDADALVSPNLFDLTEHLPKTHVLHNGNDMASNRWTYDKYFRRDGRNIGSCNWFTVASHLCFDLWEPLADLSPQEAVSRIHPQTFELAPFLVNPQTGFGQPKPVIDAEHLVDDYALSRNIAKYGLKFKTLVQLCAELGQGQDQAGYLFHQYTLTVPQKVEVLRTVLRNWNIGIADERFSHAYRTALDNGLLQTFDRAENLWHKAAMAADLDGEYWECGVYRGASAYLISQAARNNGHSPLLRLFDTFKGIPNDGHFVAKEECVRKLLRDYPNMSVRQGLVPKTFEGLENSRIAFAHLDLDQREGTGAALDFVWPRMVKGGIVVVDDYGTKDWPGVEQAVNERFTPEEFSVYPEQAVITKR